MSSSSNATKTDYLNGLSHHAYLLVGNSDIRNSLISLLEKEYKIITHGNPDFYIRNYETFTIDDSREIKVLHNTRPLLDLDKKNIGAGKKIFILTMNGITIEAQNSLLKLLEEPAEYAHFFLMIPSAHVLLPTVKSRLSFIDDFNADTSDGNSKVLKEAGVFLKANLTKRLDMIKSLTNSIDFVNAIESILYENSLAHGNKREGLIKNKKGLEAIALVSNYIHDRAPSVKMLLEYVALNV